MTTPHSTEKRACWRVREPNSTEAARTPVVLGAARGGTSMVAGVLRLLGVPMGKDLNSSHENRQFRRALLGDGTPIDRWLIPLRLLTSYRRLIARYDQGHRIWGIKDPNLNPWLWLLAPFWRNPVYILVLRNPVAAAESQVGHFQRPFAALLSRVIDLYRRLYRFAERSGRPLLVISYDEAVRNREGVVAALAEYCGVSPSPEAVQSALAFMDRQRGYQWLVDGDADLVGFVERITPQQVSGWAFSPRTPDPVTLVLLHDDVEIARTQADQPRPDVQGNPQFARLHCGFVFDLPAQGAALDTLQVVDAATGSVLRRS